ncbi:S8 family serine peptidase [Nocardioides sp. R1-1]|uniref:S8 family serine peptidase n=1 Tax=Nocardioides sp. R1-1 TaxID=3383502 RepID=UPI0038D195F3
MRLTGPVAGAVAMQAFSLVVLVGPGAASAGVVPGADGAACLEVTASTTGVRTVSGDNVASRALHVEEAQALVRAAGTEPGAGVRVVVVVDTPVDGFRAGTPSGLASGHGFAVAGIVAGPDQTEPGPVPVGIAPAARVEGAPFYETLERPVPGERAPTSADLAAALGRLADRRGPGGDLAGRVVVVVPAQVPYSAELATEVGRLAASGVLVVAAAGDRPRQDGDFPDGFQGTPRPGEDVAGLVWPAAHPGVVAVGAASPGSRGSVLRSSAIDLAAPGSGAVTTALNGGWCVVDGVSTAWAAAQVAGVAALVWSAHPGDDAARLRARLEQTASGNGSGSSLVTGFGVVQPVEAIQRDIAAMDADRAARVQPAQPPRPRADLLAGARRDALWWGLGGGSALAVLLMLRPLLSRRR